VQVSLSKGSLLDRIALRWHSDAAEQEEPLDFFSDFKSAQKVLIAPNDRVGGLFLGAPIYKLIRQAYPQAHIGLLVDESKAAIAKQIPFVDEVVTAALDKSLWTGAFRKSRNDLKHLAFDLLFCLGGDCSFRLAILCKDSGAKLRVGFAREGVAPFNIEIIGKNPEDYEVQQYLSMLRTIGLDGGDAELHWALAQDKAEQVRTRFLDEDNAKSPIIGIDLVRGEGKGLAKGQFDGIVGRVIERGAKVLLFFSLAEKKTVNYLKEAYGNRVILFEQNDLLASAALLESCQALIACNTDLLHLAISLQVPVVAIFAEKSARWIETGNPAVGIVEVQDPRAATVGQIIEGLDICITGKASA
jgi:heptosyltransferase-2